MRSILTICADCEHQALRHPRRGRALREAMACLTQLLLGRKRMKELLVVREACLQNCPLGKICVTLKRGDQEVRHHLSPDDDLTQVAAKLAGTRPSTSHP